MRIVYVYSSFKIMPLLSYMYIELRQNGKIQENRRQQFSPDFSV